MFAAHACIRSASRSSVSASNANAATASAVTTYPAGQSPSSPSVRHVERTQVHIGRLGEEERPVETRLESADLVHRDEALVRLGDVDNAARRLGGHDGPPFV